jgi:hypothetical protein
MGGMGGERATPTERNTSSSGGGSNSTTSAMSLSVSGTAVDACVGHKRLHNPRQMLSALAIPPASVGQTNSTLCATSVSPLTDDGSPISPSLDSPVPTPNSRLRSLSDRQQQLQLAASSSCNSQTSTASAHSSSASTPSADPSPLPPFSWRVQPPAHTQAAAAVSGGE